ncbi:hypothetical protein OHA61_39765 [Streptomyces sp. NBC_00885]|uniref:hypothetical protein n=1 Tax=Streptomyces sp. NBC_00885 TaxID=2975857 RepID=UPI00386A6440|nr:hypothetical protein OHA61_00040 [Streptomyces sp. NBC_00885]WSY72144.1 hypothetical protein OHA61_39765 [Streptomyces sp. NBC_00885]
MRQSGRADVAVPGLSTGALLLRGLLLSIAGARRFGRAPRPGLAGIAGLTAGGGLVAASAPTPGAGLVRERLGRV